MDGTSITLHDMQLIIFCFISLILNQAYGNSMAPSPTFTDLLSEKMQKDPFSLIAMCLFLGAIFHTFLTSKLSNIAKQMETNLGHASWKSSVLKLLGEVEIVFALWLIPLSLCFVYFKGWAATVHYFETRQYAEPIFVIAIMSVASSRPILKLAERTLRFIVHHCGGEKPSTWWICILTITPLLGSLITEPAAMTIAALLLSQRVFCYQAKPSFLYASLGLLFVNVSVGGVLTNFAAPPILMVASHWQWSSSFVFKKFGISAMLGIVCATLFYAILFYKQLKQLNKNAQQSTGTRAEESDVPSFITVCHILFLAWMVLNSHHIPLLIWGFLAFIVFTQLTSQTPVNVRNPMLVGCFLAGLVTHGGLQMWWIDSILSHLNEQLLFVGSVFLTSFNDNASITYLASLVSHFENNWTLQHAIVSGAVVGGGLTVIANAPNPAGQNLLSKFFPEASVKPLPLFLGALIPTCLMAIAFLL